MHSVHAPRFEAKVDRDGPLHPTLGTRCWVWTATKTPRGYGMFRIGADMVGAHRVSYELYRGPIPDGLHLDHLCRTPACVNPAHLEPVTPAENMRRAAPYAKPNAGTMLFVARRNSTHCPHGHEFSDDNARLRRDGSRQCRACNRERMRVARRSARSAA